MIKPSVHLNGTSADELIRQYGEAADKVNDAISAIYGAMPHGRDFYVQKDPLAHQKAVDIFMARIIALRSLKEELLTVVEYLEEEKLRRNQFPYTGRGE